MHGTEGTLCETLLSRSDTTHLGDPYSFTHISINIFRQRLKSDLAKTCIIMSTETIARKVMAMASHGSLFRSASSCLH